MRFKDELRDIEPITATEMYRVEGPLPSYIHVERAIAELAEAEAKANTGFLEKLGRGVGVIRSQPSWEGWKGWGAARQLKCAALAGAGWHYDESHLPYEQAARAYERVRQVLLSPQCNSAQELLELLESY